MLTRVTDPLDRVTVTEQDPLGRTASITDAAGGITRYGYGPFGMLHTVTDPGGAVARTTRSAASGSSTTPIGARRFRFMTASAS
ncbi:RHS repeat domain-containing protein [Sorangium sp. So ce1014]|uniref:RHS repeat domain-containing protein n=1 Tax=Sorangium sp. So ce1014 TaxID=3133326 RepID=UPI003F5F0492